MTGSLAAPPVSQPDLSNHRKKAHALQIPRSTLEGSCPCGRDGWETGRLRDGQIKMWFIQAGCSGPPPRVFALEGDSLGSQRPFSFCLKALYGARGGGSGSGCWPWCAVFGLGAAPAHLSRTECCPAAPAHLSLPVFPVVAEKREVSLSEGPWALSCSPSFSFWHSESLRKACKGAV